MALHLSWIFFKDQKWSLGAHFLAIPFLEKKRGEKGVKARVGKRSSFGWLSFPFLAPKRSSNIQEEI